MKLSILGLPGAGKDTSAGILKNILDWKIERYAEPLKSASLITFGADHDERTVKEVQVSWLYNQKRRDRGMEQAFQMCHALGFNEAQMDKASELYLDEVDTCRVMSPRKYQQLLGTNVVRAINPNTFVDRIRNIKGNRIITDTRFLNETTEKNWFVFNPKCKPNYTHSAELLASELHELVLTKSNNVISTFHRGVEFWIIRNTGTLDDLTGELQYFVDFF